MSRPDQRFARSKPPGQLLTYLMLANVAELPTPPAAMTLSEVVARRHERLVWLLTWLLPLVTYAALFPLVALSATLDRPERALWPALLFVFCAPTALVTLHFDQAVYPSLAAGLWALSALSGASAERSVLWGFAAGGVAWVATFISFSLLPALVLAPAFVVAAAKGDWRARATRAVTFLAAAATVYVGLALLAWWAAGYDLGVRYASAMENHRATRAWSWNVGELARAARLNLVEFSYWLGAPLIALFAWAWLSGARDLVRRRATPLDLAAVGTAATLLATAVLGTTKGEVARLWIFLVPAIALAAASALRRAAGPRAPAALRAVVLSSAGWVSLLKLYQDFF